jgi:hypothetical protein
MSLSCAALEGAGRVREAAVAAGAALELRHARREGLQVVGRHVLEVVEDRGLVVEERPPRAEDDGRVRVDVDVGLEVVRAEGDLLLAVEGEAAAVRERDAGLRARREAEAAEARDDRRRDLRERARRRRVRRALLVDDDDEPGAGPAAVDGERACLAFVDGVLPRSLVGDGGRDEGPGLRGTPIFNPTSMCA